jgi:hypothetical protein
MPAILNEKSTSYLASAAKSPEKGYPPAYIQEIKLRGAPEACGLLATYQPPVTTRGPPPPQLKGEADHYGAGKAMVVIKESAGWVVSSRVCCTTILSLLSTFRAKGTPVGID